MIMINWHKIRCLRSQLERRDPTGMDRASEKDKGKPLAGKSTLNRLELTAPNATAKSAYKKIVLTIGIGGQSFC